MKTLSANNTGILLSTEELIFRHTLFLLHAPFITAERAETCKESMMGLSKGLPYLSTGYNASRIPKLRMMRYCPVCVAEQVKTYGEAFWIRQHQIFGLDTCIHHNVMLKHLNIGYGKPNRHAYFPPFLFALSTTSKMGNSAVDLRLAPKIDELLSRDNICSPSLAQWTLYYKELLNASQLLRGRQVKFDDLVEVVEDCWPSYWLEKCNLAQLRAPSGWLHGISRKHRKAFSYLEHLVLLEALHSKNWSVSQAIQDAKDIVLPKARGKMPPKDLKYVARYKLRQYRLAWHQHVKAIGAKAAREGEKYKIYAWLYRYDRAWLLETNEKYKVARNIVSLRVDWISRDKQIVHRLCQLRDSLINDLALPRQSIQWFINQIDGHASIEKNRAKLPLTYLFLSRYQETIAEYQVRRFTRELIASDGLPPKWKLMRQAGVSSERMVNVAERFLKLIYE